MAQKRYLFTPGPTPVPPEVLAALAEPVLHHRAPDFREVYARVLGRLQEVHRTRSDVLLFTCSGTGGFESAVANLCSPGDRVARRLRRATSASAGPRWHAPTAATSRSCATTWGETPTAEDLRRRLGELEPVSLVFLVHSETSTGVVADVQVARRGREGGRCARRRRRRLEPRRGAARDGRLGDRRRRRRLAEGADDAAGPRDRLRLAGCVGAGGARDVAALLPRLGAHAEGAGEARQRRSRRRSRSSWPSTSRSGCCSRTGSRPRSTVTCGSGAPAAPGSRRWGSSSSRPTRTASAVVTAVRMPDGIDVRRAHARAARAPRRSRSPAARAS